MKEDSLLCLISCLVVKIWSENKWRKNDFCFLMASLLEDDTMYVIVGVMEKPQKIELNKPERGNKVLLGCERRTKKWERSLILFQQEGVLREPLRVSFSDMDWYFASLLVRFQQNFYVIQASKRNDVEEFHDELESSFIVRFTYVVGVVDSQKTSLDSEKKLDRISLVGTTLRDVMTRW